MKKFGIVMLVLVVVVVSTPFLLVTWDHTQSTGQSNINPHQEVSNPNGRLGQLTLTELDTLKSRKLGEPIAILQHLTNPAVPARQSLQNLIASFAESQPGTWGIYIVNLDTGGDAEYNADEQFNVASLYKLQVLYAAYAEERAGNLSMDEALPEGWTVASALYDMITVSDQGATFALLRRIGTDTVNALMANLGLGNSYITDWGYSTARETGALLTMMATGEAVDAPASKAMVNLLLDQQINNRLPAYLPAGTVAHKTGELDGVRNDAGIIYGPNATYVMVVISQGVPDEDAASSAIADLSASVYSYFQ